MNALKIYKELTDEEYESYLNEIYPTVNVCGYEYDPGRALRLLDPIAFNVGKREHENNQEEVWECTECNSEFDNENDANECCKE